MDLPVKIAYDRIMVDLSLEIHHGGRVCGIDEVGRGPLAGPVVAAAVIFERPHPDPALIADLGDSKTLSGARRAALVPRIQADAAWGVGAASVAEIDRLNILNATFLAMRRALAALPGPVDRALVDGNRDPGLGLPTRLVVKGDGKSASIAAASIIAKVVRDRAMARLAARYPDYGWERNAGYGVRAHLDALDRCGVCAHHRRSFRPVAARIAAD